MRDLIGRTPGHYRIVEKIGEGGMGEVYRARDERLDRDVAIKVLHEKVADDPERLARFEREAKLLASLSHQNIATLFGLEEHEGQRFLVMEFVEGEDLATRIKRGVIPLDDAMDFARQITEGLEAAHEQGIVHRDLKPANVMVDSEGQVKILDFGLAKAFDPVVSGSMSQESIAESPTLTTNMTRAGVLLGTAAYMSPEQARGKAVDKRADIWAFGGVLYEMLTGTRAFSGATSTETLAAIIRDDPDWDRIPAETPILTRRLLRQCLTKNPRDRLHDIADARLELQLGPGERLGEDQTPAAGPSRGGWLSWLPWIVAAASAAVTVTVLVGLLSTPPSGAVSKVLVGLQPAEWLGSDGPNEVPRMDWRLSRRAFALSPNGRLLVFSGGDKAGSRLYLREMEGDAATPITGTEGGMGPFFSPDGSWIGFWADGKLKKIRTDGGSPIPICDLKGCPRGSNWEADDTIVFGQEGILRVSAFGGEPQEIAVCPEGSYSHPRLLPDGETLLLTELKGSSGDTANVVVQSLTTGIKKLLVENGAAARYVPTGHLVFVRLGVLMAAPFDPKRLELTGSAAVVVDSVRQAVNTKFPPASTWEAQFDFSASGMLAYTPGGVWPDPSNSLVWVDREGNVEPLEIPEANFLVPRISPDGTRVAYMDAGFNRDDLFIHTLDRNTTTQVTHDENKNAWPGWTPDGKTITFASNRSGPWTMYSIAADGSQPAELLTPRHGSVEGYPSSWSPDGQVLAFSRWGDQSFDIWVFPTDGEPRPFIVSPSYDYGAVFSPDGAWLAYKSHDQVFVTPYPGPGPKIQVSADGGRSPVWAPNGQELFYRGPPSLSAPVWAVNITTEPELVLGRPRKLFDWNSPVTFPSRNYDVSPDGLRFLMIENHPIQVEPVTNLHVTFNWFEELKRLAPTD